MTPTQRMRHWPWLLHDNVVVGALVLFALGLILIVLGLIFSSVSALQGVGGIIFGTGLTVFLSQLANRQQLAKDANLRRKTTLYDPPHAELQTLRERLEATRTGVKPYLQWITIPGMIFPLQRPAEELPQLRCWSEFKADSRSSLDFSERMRLLLDQVLQLASDYNRALIDALTASETIFAPVIDTAITRTANSEAYHQWDRDHPSGLVSDSPSWSPRDWFVRIQLAVKTPPAGIVWATIWLSSGPMGHSRPPTLGWLLAKDQEQAVRCISAACNPPGSFPPPPREWLQAIIDEVWPSLQSHSAYATVWRLHGELFDQVSQAETKLFNKLRDIQNIYEGGPPPP
jgi:hypothetical protein